MKRTLSLILALAMIMSLFTTVSFAATYIDAEGKNLAASPNEILVGGKATLSGSLVGVASGAKWKTDTSYAEVSGTTVTGKSEGDAVFYLYAPVDGSDSDTYYKSTNTVTVKIVGTPEDYEILGAKGSKKMTVGEILNAPVKLCKKDTTDAEAGVEYTYSSSKTSVATVDGAGKITAKAAGTAVISCVVKYKGYTFPKYTVATVTVGSLDLDKTITNGNSETYAASELATEIKKAVKSATGADVTVTAIDLTTITEANGISYKMKIGSASAAAAEDGDNLGVSSSNKLIVATKAGYIGTSTIVYTATTTGGSGSYTGKITFKSDYAKTVTDTQNALFSEEAFYLDSISGISALSLDDDATTPKGVSKYYQDSDFMIDPSGYTDEWTESYTGYDKDGVAMLVTVTFEPIAYDALLYTEDEGAPFVFEMFEEFAEKVDAEQNDNYQISVEHVQFPTVSGSKWKLEKGGSAIKSSDEFTKSKLSDVTLDVSAAGYYDIPFRVYYDYKATKTGSWTTATSTYFEGSVRVYVAMDGDITYEVLYNESVTFDSDDFEALYKTKAGKTKTLDSVTVDILPYYGALYRDGKIANSNAVKADEKFYVDPSSANKTKDLDKLTYWATYASAEEYSDYVVVTMHGSGSDEIAVVEIKISGDMPFTDVAKGSTFYEYIRYCYNKNIMGGKTTTRFDATSSITRAQLVTTLYRMAGSPTTHNAKTLPFTDTSKLNAEFSNAVKWAYYNKIVGGTTSTTFDPNTAVTRQAMVKILHGYAKAYGLDLGTVYDSHLGYYTDGATVSASMKDAMNWALDYGLLSGNGNKLNPRGSTSRGAAAKILANFHSSFVG